MLDLQRRPSPSHYGSFPGGSGDDSSLAPMTSREREMEEKRNRVRERLRIMERRDPRQPGDDRGGGGRSTDRQRDSDFSREQERRDREREKARMPPAKAKAIPKLVTVGKHTVVSRALGGNWKLVYDPQLERHYPPAYLAEPEVRQAVKEKRGKVYRVDGVCPGLVRASLSLSLRAWCVP
jgi:hypothetical protein